jgi:hypothetical protein
MTKALDAVQVTVEALKKNNFDARYAPTREAARKLVLELVPPDWIVGCGDSSTIRSLGLLQDLADLGNRVLNPFQVPKVLREKPGSLPLHVINQTSHGVDVFLASSNAVSMDGKIINIDGGGNRVSGIIFGSKLRILVIGRNKIVKDADAGIRRIKDVIVPAHSRTAGARWNVPCVAAGKCVEPEIKCEAGLSRACNIVVILEANPNMPGSKLVPIIVDDDLGLGWDPAWPQARKDKIYEEYKKFTPPHRPIEETKPG